MGQRRRRTRGDLDERVRGDIRSSSQTPTHVRDEEEEEKIEGLRTYWLDLRRSHWRLHRAWRRRKMWSGERGCPSWTRSGSRRRTSSGTSGRTNEMKAHAKYLSSCPEQGYDQRNTGTSFSCAQASTPMLNECSVEKIAHRPTRVRRSRVLLRRLQ